MKKFIDKLIEKLEETDFNDIQMVVREVLLKYGFPYESVVQDEVWDALDELSSNKFAIKIVKKLAEEYKDKDCSECSRRKFYQQGYADAEKEYKGGWIDVEHELPPNDEYILLSFDNFSLPQIGRYEEDEEGGAFYLGDEDVSLSSYGLFVNAWRLLPEPYKEGSE